MIKHVGILYLILALSGCTEVNFKEPQPKGVSSMKEVPHTLRGRYLGIDKETGKVEDTLVVTERGFQLTGSSKEKSKEDQIFLCDTVFIKRHKGYYFVNIKNNIAWRTYVLKQEDNDDLTHMVLQQKENTSFTDFLFSLSGQIMIDSIQTKDKTYYMIDPSPKQLIGLIENDYFVKFTWKKIR